MRSRPARSSGVRGLPREVDAAGASRGGGGVRATSGRVAGAVVASGEVEDGSAARRVPSVPGDDGVGVPLRAPDLALASGAAPAAPDIRVGVGRTGTRRACRA